MLKISRESEINLINVLIDNDIISGKDLVNIKKISTEGNKSQIDAVFELKLTDEKQIVDVLVKEQSLDIVDLSKQIWKKSFGRTTFVQPRQKGSAPSEFSFITHLETH